MCAFICVGYVYNTHIYIYIYVCVCVCVFVSEKKENNYC